MKALILALACALHLTVLAEAPQGAWRGELNLGQMRLPLVFNFSEGENGEPECTLDSPSQGATGIPASVTLCTADSITVTCSAIGATYRGAFREDRIEGKFSQRGYTFALNLSQSEPIEVRRPQTPRPPFPYSVIDTVFIAPDGAILAATLTLPPEASVRQVPAVVMVTGSGAQNRDEEVMEHKPFAVIADYLARRGIASLRYDDRGTAQSTGDFSKATTYTFKDDAASALEFLKSFKNIGKVGILGHSEGGTVAFMLGADRKPDFIVSLAGMAVSGKETLMRQNSYALEVAGMTGAEHDAHLLLIEKVLDEIARQSRKGVNIPIDIDSLVKEVGVEVDPQMLSSLKMTQQMRSPWFDKFVTLRPEKFLKKIKCPLLAINGSNDTQVDAETNLSVVKQAVPHAEVHLMPGLNHPLQHATTGEVSEYGEIRETIAPEVLKLIVEFINRL